MSQLLNTLMSTLLCGVVVGVIGVGTLQRLFTSLATTILLIMLLALAVLNAVGLDILFERGYRSAGQRFVDIVYGVVAVLCILSVFAVGGFLGRYLRLVVRRFM